MQPGGGRPPMPYGGGGPSGYGSGSRYGPGGYDRSQQHNSMNPSRGAPIGGRSAAAPPMRGGGYGGGGMMEGPPGAMPWVGHGMPPPHGGSGARFCAVKLRGLPFGVKEYEIGMFLGLEPIDVVIVQRHGKSTGEAFAVLAHPAELDMALRKNKAYLGTRYIEVFETRKIDYYKAIVDTMSHNGGMHERRGRDNRSRSRTPPRKPRGSQQKSQGPEPGTTSIVKLRGLPFSADPERVLEFFSDSDLGIDLPSTEKVLIATGADHRPNGMAFVEFDSPRTAEIALKKHKQMMGSRYVEVFLASVDERARYIPLH